MSSQGYGAIPKSKEYTYEEMKDEPKDKGKKSGDQYHSLAGNRDFELQ